MKCPLTQDECNTDCAWYIRAHERVDGAVVTNTGCVLVLAIREVVRLSLERQIQKSKG